MPDLAGKVIFITGGTAGIGKATITQLLPHHPSHIIFTGRPSSSERAQSFIASVQPISPETRLTFLPLDLSSLSSIKSACQTFVPSLSLARIDTLILGAGIMAVPPALTADGYELQFGTNHLGHALIFTLLLPLLRISPDPRVISLTSSGYFMHPSGGIRFDELRTAMDSGAGSSWVRYGQSKLANILYTSEISRRYPEVMAVALHPGVVKTDLVDGLRAMNKAFVYVTNLGKLKSVEEGAWNTLWAVGAERESMQSGGYYEPVGNKRTLARMGGDQALAEELWDWTEGELRSWVE